MLIRVDNDDLVEYPDELVAMVLASPFYGDLSDEADWSIEEVNCLIHAMLGTFCDDSLTHEENIEKIRQIHSQFGPPDELNLARANALIKFYNENLKESEIGRSDRETIRTVFPFQSNASKTDDGNTIDYVPVNIKSLPSS